MDEISTPIDVRVPEKPRGERSEFVSFLLTALLIVLPIRLWIAQPFIVNGASMYPTFENGDYLIVDELTFRFRQPEQGEVVIFRYPKDPSKFFIKRITGLPGETVDGTKLGDKDYYVEGDNRDASSDSRIWGPVPRKNIVGRPIVRLLPFKDFDFIPGTSDELRTKYAN